MAFGALKGTLRGFAASITNPFSATGSVAVSVGDLIVGVLAQQTALTITAMGDNLHGASTYTSQNVGNDDGNATGRMFYIRVTTAGTLTSVNAVTTASTNDVAFIAAVFEGPFTAPPIDRNPANNAGDITIPHACPPSGTLAQADELVIGWCSLTGTTEVSTADSPFNDAGEVTAAGLTIHANIAYLLVSATTTLTPSFSQATDAASSNVLGTASFKKDTSVDTTTVTQATITLTGAAINEIHPQITAAAITVTGQAINEIHPQVTAASITLTGQAIAETELVLVSQATITLTGQTINEVYPQITAASIVLTAQNIAANDTELVSGAAITLTGQTVNEVYPTVSSAQITLSGQDITPTDTSGADATTVDAAAITLTGSAIADLDTVLVAKSDIALTGGTITLPADTGTDTTTVTAATITLYSGGVSYELREDGGYELREDGGRELREGGSGAVAVNDTEAVSSASVSLTGQTVNEVYPNVSPATITLTGGAIGVNDTELVSQSTITLTGQAVAESLSTPVTQSTITLTGGLIIESDTVLVSKADITLTGSDITLIDTAGDTTIVSKADITLTGGVIGLIDTGADVTSIDPASIILTGGDITLVDTSTDVAGGTHHRWPLYVNWHLKDKCWRRVEDCPPEIAEEIDRELPYEAPLAPKEIRRLVGTLSALVPPAEFRVEEDDTETVALLIAMED